MAHGLLLPGVLGILLYAAGAGAQRAPSRAQADAYTGLHAAAWSGDVAQIRALAAAGADLEATDAMGRTPLHVAAFASHDEAVRRLVEAGADPNALEGQRYDIVTIAAVADDLDMVRLALELGANAANVTSPYDGTALIAAAHLGHVEVVRTLIAAGAPLDHVNNLHWTALIEAVVLGDGGPRHQDVVRALVEAGADRELRDREGRTALWLAEDRGFHRIASLLRR